jgi:uncharacterized RmlC-like cupin family protein
LKEPIIILPTSDKTEKNVAVSAVASSFIIHEWRGSGPDYLHVHYEDDEAWHVLEGTLIFKFSDRTVEVSRGTTVFVPAGVPHTYIASNDARYLIVLTRRLEALISELQKSSLKNHPDIMKKYRSEILS